MENQSFLGRGWSFPPEFNNESRAVKMLEDEEDIRSSLQILLSTRPGERIMVPGYGCNLDELLFSPLNLTIKTYVVDLIRTAILYYEPRIDVNKIEIDPTDEFHGVLLIQIEYTIRATNSRMNMVYPFYIEEGNEL
ncbi:MAG: GPW/gp25 family protein [Proteiniphilum sp.]|jgi:phage baseplate assembly protein W|nr:GPW/gp25 family protein [Proteiniphilum sp.]MDD2938703.1 GPW/gp25 family protein [Proteiniphilum sp.]MDD3076741.1 GPW/gp25 family protein [Proteiniphilum sp.]MDD3955972.1 GPW/gp25 family protein [Proteiniphilum sp.]MDD4451966.1 GPW/gp25 family protein [Proteiniphilum sp.]